MPDHLNNYKNFSDYVRDKKNIVAFQSSRQLAILNWDDPHCRAIASSAPGQVWWFSSKKLALNNSAFITKQGLFLRRRQNYLLLPGRLLNKYQPHELSNMLAASLVAVAQGVSIKDIRHTLINYQRPTHRYQYVKTVNSIRYINDTTATIPEAAIAAIKHTGQKTVFIGGGADKNLHYSLLGQTISQYCRAAILFAGTATDKLKHHIKKVPIFVVDSMTEALSQATKVARDGDTVLLSPGAASFGIFDHEFDRGQQFIKAVNSL